MPNLHRDPWYDNLIQFARLIAELDDQGAFPQGVVEKLEEDMGLEPDQVADLIGRAHNVWHVATQTSREPQRYADSTDI